VNNKARKSLAIGGGFGCGCLFLAFLLAFTPLGFVLYPVRQIWNTQRNRSEYSRNRSYYESLIESIDKNLKESGQEASYLAPDSPAELKPIDWNLIPDDDRYDFNVAHRTIYARRFPDGRLCVKFETYDMGHAGYWYLVYSSGELDPGDVTIGEVTNVAPHWWAVLDNSH